MSRTLLPAAMGEGRIKVMDAEGEVLSVECTFRSQRDAANTWLKVVDRLVKVSGMDELNKIDAGAARAEPESMGLQDIERELAEFAELLRIQPCGPTRVAPKRSNHAP